MNDDGGAFRLEIERKRLTGIGRFQFVWAYHPGRTVGVQQVDLTKNGELPPVRVTLAEPSKRTLTILDSEGHPVAGARVATVMHAAITSPQFNSFVTPDDCLERMTIATGADGAAAISYLSSAFDPQSARVTAPGIAPHILALPYQPGSDRYTLKLGQPARVAGSVFYDSGEPAADLPLEVWVENSYYLPRVPAVEKALGDPTVIRFNPGPVRTGADGTFSTPPKVMTGRSYRISVRTAGDPLVSSDWLLATTELTNFPALRLRRHRQLTGLVQDRRGEPIAGARVFLPSGAPATTTDARGRFLLDGVLPDRTYLLVQAKGFRLQGWPAVPARQAEERKLIVVRTDEPADRTLLPQPAAISLEESRAMARRLLESFLQTTLEKGDDIARLNALGLLNRIDPARALELLEAHPFQNPGFDAVLRFRIAAALSGTDPVEAESIVAAIANPALRARGYVWLAEAVPAAEPRSRPPRLLERATVQANAPAGGGAGADIRDRLNELTRVAGGWLDLGDVEKARPLIREGLKLIEALPPADRNHRGFLPAAARVELDPVLSLLRDMSSARRRSCYVAIAPALAREHPAEAERVFGLIDDLPNAPSQERKSDVALRLCLAMAKTDPERAKRLLAVLKSPREQAIAWALLALALADRDQAAARSALTESIRLIDGLDGPPSVAERIGRPFTVAFNPAASILPIVERIMPEHLDEVFWKAVALMPKNDTARARGVVDPPIAYLAVFLARYDRQVADLLVSEATASASRGPVANVWTAWTTIRARATYDPRVALATFESFPAAPAAQSTVANELLKEAREWLITCLIEPDDEHWKHIWSTAGIPLD